MQRREFLRTAGGAAGATAAAGGAATPAAADGGLAALQEDGNETDTGESEGEQPEGEDGESGSGEQSGDGGSGGGSVTVTVGPGGDFAFDPASVEVPPGTTVVWEWDSPNHNVAPTSVPEEAQWEGHQEIVDAPYTYEHTFETEGTYEYQCDPHAQSGMVGDVVVSADASLGGGGGGGEEVDPAHMGVLLQKHFIGAATFMGIFVTLVFTFYLLKYGESAHSSAPGKRD